MKKLLIIMLMLFSLGVVFAEISTKDEIIPDFMLSELSGEEVALSTYVEGKDISYLVFFTTWCPWCSKQLEAFQGMSEEVSSNVGFVAIGFDKSTKKIKNKLNKLGVTFPSVVGTTEIASYFNVSGIPVTVVIDKNGKVLDQVVGFRKIEYFSSFL